MQRRQWQAVIAGHPSDGQPNRHLDVVSIEAAVAAECMDTSV
jgi:hypothetical protein